ncbi:MAG: pyridoxal phosphate-dependent aminotransferase [bacterium]
MRNFSENVLQTMGGERADHMTLKRPQGMIQLDSGTPSFPTPEHICNAAKKALQDGLTHYAPGQGDPEFLQAVCENIEKECNSNYSTDSVIATNGGSSGIYTVMTAFLGKGDEVILMDPTFSLYSHVAKQIGGIPVNVPHGPDYHLDIQAIRDAITDKTRLLLICNPNNPTGLVYTQKELQSLAELCSDNNIILVSDEAYAKILQPGFKHVPLLSFTEHKNNLILLDTFSKTYSMTGWRLGSLIVPEDMHSVIFGIHRSINGPICSFVQRAGAAALRGPQNCVLEMRKEYQKRGKLMYELAKEIPRLIPLEPQGGFYLYCRYDFPINATDLRKRIWDAGVAIRSGTEFGQSGENHVRLTYSVSEETIEKGMQVVSEFFKKTT